MHADRSGAFGTALQVRQALFLECDWADDAEAAGSGLASTLARRKKQD
jgi:hypothetical protein